MPLTLAGTSETSHHTPTLSINKKYIMLLKLQYTTNNYLYRLIPTSHNYIQYFSAFLLVLLAVQKTNYTINHRLRRRLTFLTLNGPLSSSKMELYQKLYI